MEKYRFDDAYGAVYEYDNEAHAYIFCGKYGVFGITPRMDDDEKGEIMSTYDLSCNEPHPDHR